MSIGSFLLRATACVKTLEKGALSTAGGTAVTLPDSQAPVVTDLGNGLGVVYLVDEGEHLTYVQHHHLTAINANPKGLHEMGLINLSKRAEQKLRMVNQGAIYGLLLDGQFEASLILLDDLWDKTLAHLAPNGFIAALPSRDVLAFCDARSAQGIAELRSIVNRIFPDGDHLLTRELYQRRNGQWTPFRETPAS
jgi:uncharacterized protein YtpQ (UPF0354 family)